MLANLAKPTRNGSEHENPRRSLAISRLRIGGVALAELVACSARAALRIGAALVGWLPASFTLGLESIRSH